MQRSKDFLFLYFFATTSKPNFCVACQIFAWHVKFKCSVRIIHLNNCEELARFAYFLLVRKVIIKPWTTMDNHSCLFIGKSRLRRDEKSTTVNMRHS